MFHPLDLYLFFPSFSSFHLDLPYNILVLHSCTQRTTFMVFMMKLLALATFLLPVLSQSTTNCALTLTPTNDVKPSAASGYTWHLVATGLSSPRSIEFDRAGNLLVVEQTNGNGSVSALALLDNGGTCVSTTSKKTLVTDSVSSSLVLLPGPTSPGEPFKFSVIRRCCSWLTFPSAQPWLGIVKRWQDALCFLP